MNPGWITGIRDQCLKAGVAVFFKQRGGVFKRKRVAPSKVARGMGCPPSLNE